jgi:hypothetical protein
MRSARWDLILLFLGGLLVALVITFPLVLRPDSWLVFHDDRGAVRLSDQFACERYLEDAHKAIANHRSLWPVIFKNPNFAISPLYVAVGSTISLVVSSTVANSLFCMAAVALTFVCAFVYAHDLTRSNVASAYAGFVFAGSNYMVHHIVDGHGNLVALFWIPLIFLLAGRVCEKPNRSYPLLLAASLVGLVLSSEHYALYLGILLPIYVIVAYPRTLFDRQTWLRIALSAAVTLVLIAYFFWIRAQSVPVQHTVATSLRWSLPSLTDLLGRNTETSVGSISAVLAIVGMVRLARDRNRLGWALLALAVVSLCLMIGPVHPLAPYSLLTKVIPPLAYTRTPLRFVVFLLFAVAALSAYGIAKIESSLSKRWRVPGLVGLCVLAFLVQHAGAVYWMRRSVGSGLWVKSSDELRKSKALPFTNSLLGR